MQGNMSCWNWHRIRGAISPIADRVCRRTAHHRTKMTAGNRRHSVDYLMITLMVILHISSTGAQPEGLRIGIFPNSENDGQVALSLANEDQQMSLVTIPQSTAPKQIDRVNETFRTMAGLNLHAFVGYHNIEVAMAAEKLAITQLCTDLDNRHGNEFSLHMLPSSSELMLPIMDVIQSYEWKEMAVFYEESLDHGVITALVQDSKENMKLRRIPIDISQDNLRETLLEIRDLEIRRFLILMRKSATRSLLSMARRLGMTAEPNAWIVLNMGNADVVSGILDDLAVNMTMVSMVTTDATETISSISDDINGYVRVAVMADALSTIAHSVAGYDVTRNDDDAIRKRVAQNVKRVHFDGSTGLVAFDSRGLRVNYTIHLDLYNGVNTSKIGEWRSHPELEALRNLEIQNMYQQIIPREPFSLKGRTLKIVFILEAPFAFMETDNPEEELVGNDRYKGYSIDLISELAQMLDFRYELYPVPDGKFGEITPTGEWNGVIGEVLSGNATMSIAPLSINTEREYALDFTKPFRNRNIMLLMKTPESTAGYFQFMNPLSYKVWICIFLAMVLCTATLYALEKYSSKVSKAFPKLNGQESAWFMFGALVGSGSETTPVTIPGRILTSAWWFFALILTSTYTANLAAFLTVKKINSPISNVGDLVDQTNIQYGTVHDSGVANFFRNTKIEPFSRMWTQMSEVMADSMVSSSEEGIERVKEGNYAFLWDSSVTSYVASIDCDVTEIGPPFDTKGLGIALPPGAVYLEQLSLAVLNLAEKGKLMEIEQKWWHSFSSDCPTLTEAGDETTELELDNVAGLFFVLIVGAVLGALACVVDYTLHKKSEKVTLPTEDAL